MAMRHLNGKMALVIGLGISGRAAAEFLLSKGAVTTAVDQNSEVVRVHEQVKKLCQLGLKLFSDKELLEVSSFDLVVVSPGIPPEHPLYQAALQSGVEIIGEVELACRFLDQKCIGITGTNGKTTVTLLVAHVLNQNGILALALGNVGIPLTAEIGLGNKDSVLVVELSSYQIETLHSQVVDVGVILNITPDHLDRYGSMDKYAQAKIHLKECLKPSGKLFVEAKCYEEYKPLFEGFLPQTYGYPKGSDLYTNQREVFVSQAKAFDLPSQYQDKVSHDVENLLAAFALCREFGISAAQFLTSAASFKKPSHRIEFVKNIDGVSYYDDSKGTNIDAVMRAVESLSGDTILIAGGVDKGASYLPWVDAFGGKVKAICAIGQAAAKMKQELGQYIRVEIFSSLEEAVRNAAEIAIQGQIVLLSPGCSSWDMFKDYAHRGNEFKKIVNQLTEDSTIKV